MQNMNNSCWGKVRYSQQCDEAKIQVYTEFLGRLVWHRFLHLVVSSRITFNEYNAFCRERTLTV